MNLPWLIDTVLSGVRVDPSRFTWLIFLILGITLFSSKFNIKAIWYIICFYLIDRAWYKIDFFVSYCPKDIHSICDGEKNKRVTNRTYFGIYYFIVGKLARAFILRSILMRWRKNVWSIYVSNMRCNSFIFKGLNHEIQYHL